MEEKVLFKSFNGVSYSDEEVQEYMDLGNLTEYDIATISGAVQTKLGLSGIRRSNGIVSDELDEDEKVEKIVKVRDIRAIKVLTISSMFGGTMGASMDYKIFDNMYFTNKKLYFVDTNVVNQPLNNKSRELNDIIGIRFTSRDVKIIKEKNGELGIKLVANKFKMLSIIMSVLFAIYIGFGIAGVIEPDFIISLFGAGVMLWTILKVIQDLWLDRIKIAMKDGYVWDILIASYDYEKCRDYLVKLSKRYK